MIDRDEIAVNLIDDLRDRDDVAHVGRFDYENQKIEVIVEPEDIDDAETVFFSSAILERLAEDGFGVTYANYNTDSKYPSGARVMGFERL